jgi:hypothetical protein
VCLDTKGLEGLRKQRITVHGCPEEGNKTKIEIRGKDEVDLPRNVGKHAKVSTSTSEDSALGESPDSVVGQDCLTPNANDLVDSVNNLNRAPSTSTKKGRVQVSPPPLRPSAEALLEAPIELPTDHGDTVQPHATTSKGLPPRASALDIHSTRPPALLQTSVGGVGTLSGLTDPKLEASISSSRQSAIRN